MRDRLAEVAVSRAQAALEGGRFDESWDWIQRLTPERRPAQVVASCLDGLSRRASADLRWGEAEDFARDAVAAERTTMREQRLAALRRRQPLLDQEQAAVIAAKVPEPEHLPASAMSPELREVYACGAYHSRGKESGAPWSRYLRMSKKPPDKDWKAISTLAAKFMAHDIAVRTRLLDEVELVVPVPANPDRYAKRLASLPHELAEGVGSILALPRVADAVMWRADMAHLEMKKLSGVVERREAAAQAFCAGPGADRVRDRAVLLIDDITTSGSTLRSCARILRAAGAREVYGYCLAHTEG